MVGESIDGHVQRQRSLARAYIQQLRAGQRPEGRPELGEWEAVVQNIERAYEKSHRDPGGLELVIDALMSQNQALAELLAPPPPSLDDVVRAERSQAGYPELPEDVCLPAEMGQQACRFLEVYERFSRAASPEGYDDFHVFCGVWLLSVVAARRVYLPLNMKRIYTNVMIALCARTSLFAKSSTALVAKDVLYAAGLGYLLGPDRASPAKLMSDMAGNTLPANYAELPVEKQERIRMRLAMAGQRGLFFDEFGKFVQGMLKKGSTTSDFSELFLTLDACPAEYENSTIARGGEPIQKPYLPLLGSMTPANLKENARSGADFWTDGFWARFSFIAAPADQYKDQPLDARELQIPTELVATLRNWHWRLGIPDCQIEPVREEVAGKGAARYRIVHSELPETACTITRDAYDAWRCYRSALKRMLVDFPHEDFHGSYIRLPETAMRMAILMASLENQNHIDMRHWAKAQELAELLRKNLHELYRQVNCSQSLSDVARAEDEIIRKLGYLADKGVASITVAQLKSSYLKAYSLKDLREIMDSMVRAGVLRKEVTPHALSGKYSLVTLVV
ncbi:DUF3987 domain-containing protein [Dictyobacter kobayashii]|uniref:DUF3987 domain-containing protein n=1 Tax=Dictyobacter kobayashii TaxID=2014872 RepID=A0A402AEU2_9CHLR|nr:DUF3987 domain-containing protein [Dictyobacter kobayashii]GCE17572.1 hypothetical protein KDK_13720 [Dictyobacter kobayashii]